jgi:hypothetical protein
VLSAVLRRDFTGVASITGASITVAGSGPSYTLTRAAGSFLTDGIKIGMVVRLTVGSFNAANLNKNLLVTQVTATVLTVRPVNGVAMVAEGPIASATIATPGKVTYAPTSGHTDIYYTAEDWSPSVPLSERSTDVKFISAEMKMPGSGNATISFTGSGLDQTNAATVYFTAPTAETSTEAATMASGLLMVGSTAQAVVTDLNITIDGKPQLADGVAGGNARPDIFRGILKVTGSFTAYFDSATLQNLFVDETQTYLVVVLTSGTAASADFVTIMLPRIDITDTDRDDPQTGQKRTYQFSAEYNAVSAPPTNMEATTIMVTDSQAA